MPLALGVGRSLAQIDLHTFQEALFLDDHGRFRGLRIGRLAPPPGRRGPPLWLVAAARGGIKELRLLLPCHGQVRGEKVGSRRGPRRFGRAGAWRSWPRCRGGGLVGRRGGHGDNFDIVRHVRRVAVLFELVELGFGEKELRQIFGVGPRTLAERRNGRIVGLNQAFPLGPRGGGRGMVAPQNFGINGIAVVVQDGLLQ